MIHERSDPHRWEKLKHYLLVFRDNIFECLAESYKVEVMRESLEYVTELARMRLFERKKSSQGIDDTK